MTETSEITMGGMGGIAASLTAKVKQIQMAQPTGLQQPDATRASTAGLNPINPLTAPVGRS